MQYRFAVNFGTLSNIIYPYFILFCIPVFFKPKPSNLKFSKNFFRNELHATFLAVDKRLKEKHNSNIDREDRQRKRRRRGTRRWTEEEKTNREREDRNKKGKRREKKKTETEREDGQR